LELNTCLLGIDQLDDETPDAIKKESFEVISESDFDIEKDTW
jgi:hypothetical protein